MLLPSQKSQNTQSRALLCKRLHKTSLLAIAALFLTVTFPWTAAQAQKTYSVASPDGKTSINLAVSTAPTLSIVHGGATLLEPSVINLQIDSVQDISWKVSKFTKTSVDQWIHPVVPVKFKNIEDHYNEGTIQFAGGVSLVLRAYNDGVAYRWIITHKGPFKVWKEDLHQQYHPKDSAWYALEDRFYSHNERVFRPYEMDSIGSKQLGSLPMVVAEGSAKVLFTEADLYDYAGLWLTGDGNGGVRDTFPDYPKTQKERGDRDRLITSREAYIAVGTDQKALPWRLWEIEDKDGGLLTSTLVYQLSRSTNEDYSWVKPGKVAWDWWNDNNVYNVDFRAGINTQTYKYYVDFAAKSGLSYIILDEGWSPVDNIVKVVPDINMEDLVAYANSKNVGVILWVSWLALDHQLNEALDLYSKWGIKGIKVDFMQRDDQLMVNYYEKVAKATAQRHMLVDFHGAYKPTGLDRLYPNALTREGVFGNENMKWFDPKDPRVTGPEHNVTLAFTRMAVGPMDFTPGAMLNATKDEWRADNSNPMSNTTRTQQLAMYVVYESPLQMLCDNPTRYYKEPECMDFLSTVPVTWDSTVVLQAKVGDYVAVARLAPDGSWYIGAMTDWTPRDLTMNLSFLPQGSWTMDSWADGINADRNAQDFKRVQNQRVTSGQTITVHLAPGGGFAARIRKAN
jgi:alpha-glucosidase